MKKAFLVAAAALVFLGIAGPVAWKLSHPAVVETAAVRRAPVLATVFATGHVEPREWRALRAPRAGVIAAVLVRERQEVRAGETLLVLRDTARESRRERLKADLDQAARDLAPESPHRKALEARRAEAAAQAGWAERELARGRVTFEAGASSRRILDELESQARVAAEALRTVEEEHQRELERLASLRRGLEAELATLDAQEADDRIASPIDGTVLTLDAEPGEYVGTERVLVKVGDLRELWIEADVDEDDIARVRPGQEVLVRLAGAREPVSAVVHEILPDADRGTKTYRVRALFAEPRFVPDPESPLGFSGRTRVADGQGGQEAFSGMSVELGIVVDRKEEALVVPRSALTPRGTVFVVEGGRLVERAVKRGIENFELAEVLEGVAEGEAVVARGTAGLRPGQRARGKAP